MSREKWEKSFNTLSRVHDASRVFEDFLDYSIDQFIINPNVKLFDFKKYAEEDYKEFYSLFCSWIFCMNAELENHTWYDFLGTVYTEVVQSRFKAGNLGQFFTPSSVCDLMSQLNYYSDVHDGKEDVLTCADYCCGSGRMLLSWHSLRPRDLCFGQDIDRVSCKMSVLNFLIHGIKGSVNHMDSISLDWWAGWKINEFIDAGQLSIMQVGSFHESMIFLGHKWEESFVKPVMTPKITNKQETLSKWIE